MFEKKYVVWSDLTDEMRKNILSRPTLQTKLELQNSVASILRFVKENGDQALKDLSLKYDKVELERIKVSKDEVKSAYEKVSVEFIDALKASINNVRKFHDAQKIDELSIEVQEGIHCRRIQRAIEKVGLYIPGGTAPLPSTVVMLGVPAILAGCKKIVMCSPPTKDQKIDPSILVAANEVGITEIYSVGGAQAVAAMAFGTETIPKVFKVFGPGNSWVTEAKQQVSTDPQGASLDMPAGPSEVLVLADESASPDFVAADLLSQAEHGEDSQVILIANSAIKIEQVISCIAEQLERLSRKELLKKSLQHARFILASDVDEAIQISNEYAPEHLIVHMEDSEKYLNQIQSAGSVFLGPYSPESVGDYASGTNHVLPTYGYARSYSGVSLDSFKKSITVQSLSKEGLLKIGPVVEKLAETERLDAHKLAVSIRLDEIRKNVAFRDEGIPR